jgi:hypothetical protein
VFSGVYAMLKKRPQWSSYLPYAERNGTHTMGYSGPIECPKCNYPILRNTKTCPHCYSRIPFSVPWNQGSLGMCLVIAAAVLLVLGCDHYLGTHIVESAASLLGKGSNR